MICPATPDIKFDHWNGDYSGNEEASGVFGTEFALLTLAGATGSGLDGWVLDAFDFSL